MMREGTEMPSENGDYLARFERMEKVLETLIQVQHLQADNLAEIVSFQRAQADRMDRSDARVNNLATKIDDLVGAIRSLIDRIPPQTLR
jgi:hypothetical protein